MMLTTQIHMDGINKNDCEMEHFMHKSPVYNLLQITSIKNMQQQKIKLL